MDSCPLFVSFNVVVVIVVFVLFLFFVFLTRRNWLMD